MFLTRTLDNVSTYLTRGSAAVYPCLLYKVNLQLRTGFRAIPPISLKICKSPDLLTDSQDQVVLTPWTRW